MNIAEMKTEKLEMVKDEIDYSVATIRGLIGRDDPSANLLATKSLAIAAELERRKAKESRPTEFPESLWLVHRDENDCQSPLGLYSTEGQADAALSYLRASNKYLDFDKTMLKVDSAPEE